MAIIDNRQPYKRLGVLLRCARTKRGIRVKQMADQLGVHPSFVYLVEQGCRKPKDGHFGNWASTYGVPYVDLWKSIGRIPMDLVASLIEDGQKNPYVLLNDLEKTRLLPFLEYVQWTTVKTESTGKNMAKHSHHFLP